jgi:hypothetical protein
LGRSLENFLSKESLRAEEAGRQDMRAPIIWGGREGGCKIYIFGHIPGSAIPTASQGKVNLMAKLPIKTVLLTHWAANKCQNHQSKHEPIVARSMPVSPSLLIYLIMKRVIFYNGFV